MGFNSSSAWTDAAASSGERSLESGWWPLGSASERTSSSSYSDSLVVSDSYSSFTPSSGPVIVTPSSLQLYSSSETDTVSLSQFSWSRSSWQILASSTLESSSSTEAFDSSTATLESTSPSLLPQSSSSLAGTVSSSFAASASSEAVTSSSLVTSYLDSSVIESSISTPSSEIEASSSSVLVQETSSSVQLTPSPSLSSLIPTYTTSQDSRSVYYIYTQLYHITGSTTTFDTGLPTTTARARTAGSSFSIPTSTQTRGLQFYENWLNGDLGEASGPSSPAKNRIIGGVVGGVGGAILCGIIVWLMFFRRRKDKTKVTRGFTSEIGRRAGYPLPSQSLEHDQEKPPSLETNNGQTAFLSRIKNKAMAQMSKNKGEPDSPRDNGNPFQDEFNFQARGPPPVPPPRANAGAYGSHAVANQGVPIDHRFSYVSSMTDSSFISSGQGDYSSMSSTSIRLASDGGRNYSESSYGFLREVI